MSNAGIFQARCSRRLASTLGHRWRILLLVAPFAVASFLAMLSITTWHPSSGILEQEEAVVMAHATQRPSFHTRNRFTLDDFVVAGVNLGQYGLSPFQRPQHSDEPPFELFDDFDLTSELSIANETISWVDLVRLRRHAEHPTLSFYVDKVARKRWWTGRMDTPKAFALNYKAELTESGRIEDEEAAILQLLRQLNQTEGYAAKPSHLSCSGGVWLTKQLHNGTTLVGHGKKPLQVMNDFSLHKIASSLAKDLQTKQRICGRRQPESIALQNVKPGLLVEERFTMPFYNDDKGGMEFKVFTIWGRVWMGIWRPGQDGVKAFIFRNGTTLPWREGKSESLLSWVDWSHIVDMAETLGAHKDMFRTDIFVGVPAGSPVLGEGVSEKERLAAVQYVVSETEIHPTPLRGTEEIFDEAGRLWLAGYRIGNYRVVPDTEVPLEFVETGFLSAKES